VQGRTITLKLKTRRKGAGEPIKFMGCGDCETVSRSMTVRVERCVQMQLLVIFVCVLC
jgi:hypothetical protein